MTPSRSSSVGNVANAEAAGNIDDLVLGRAAPAHRNAACRNRRRHRQPTASSDQQREDRVAGDHQRMAHAARPRRRRDALRLERLARAAWGKRRPGRLCALIGPGRRRRGRGARRVAGFWPLLFCGGMELKTRLPAAYSAGMRRHCRGDSIKNIQRRIGRFRTIMAKARVAG